MLGIVVFIVALNLTIIHFILLVIFHKKITKVIKEVLQDLYFLEEDFKVELMLKKSNHSYGILTLTPKKFKFPYEEKGYFIIFNKIQILQEISISKNEVKIEIPLDNNILPHFEEYLYLFVNHVKENINDLNYSPFLNQLGDVAKDLT